MSSLCNGGSVDAFALVAYLPAPLAGFVDAVRRELTPGCRLRAHITLLPPRQITCDPTVLRRELQSKVSRSHAIRIEPQEVRVFDISQVVYLSIGEGYRDLLELHQRLNQGPCLASEVWDFVPHITFAQDLAEDAVANTRRVAEERWRQYAGPRAFMLDKVALVQGCPENGWADLETWELPSPVLV